MPHPSRSQLVEPLGLVAGMGDGRGLGAVIDRATPHPPDTRMVTAGHAVNALVRNGLGGVHHQRDRGPRFVPATPRSRLWAPVVSAAPPRQDETRGRALDTRAAGDVTARSRLRAAAAAERLGRAAPLAPLDRTSVPGEGRAPRADAPAAPVVPRTPGASRAPRPDRPQVRRALRREHPAGLPVLLHPRRGHRRETPACGRRVKEPRAPGHTTDGPPAGGADRARSREAHRPPLAKPQRTGRTRVPAPWPDAPAPRAPADRPPMAPRPAGERAHRWASTAGGVAPRGGRLDSAPRPPQAPHTVGRQRRTPGEPAGHAGPPRGRTPVAGEAAAPPALAPCPPG
jgi:hypothetical protein